ncbi:hypothetical protein CLOM_g11979, partial [Closterium sp. NIES-68]
LHLRHPLLPRGSRCPSAPPGEARPPAVAPPPHTLHRPPRILPPPLNAPPPTARHLSWGEKLFTTALATCSTPAPRHAAKKRRVWTQASLPPTLGGLGITEPAAEGGHSFLTSVAAAAHLLGEMLGRLHPELASLEARTSQDPPKVQRALALEVQAARYTTLLEGSRRLQPNPLIGHTQ